MQTGRFISKLVDDIEQNYQTKDLENLLNNKNLAEVWNLANEGAGIYDRVFPDDMAVTRTVITMDVDNSGRLYYNNDTVIVKFTGTDRELILEALKDKLQLLERMKTVQNNSMEHTHPLAPIQI